jgi:hypothetical protein
MLEHLGQTEPAREQLRLALQVDPRLESASEMLARLEGRTQPQPEQPQPQPEQPQTGAVAPPVQPVQPVVFTDAQPLPEK